MLFDVELETNCKSKWPNMRNACLRKEERAKKKMIKPYILFLNKAYSCFHVIYIT